MIDWFMWVQVAVACAAGAFCVIAGLARRAPDDFSMGATLLVELFLLAQLVVAIVMPFVGAPAPGNVVEFYAYLLTAIVMLPLAGFWALLDRSRWSTVILGVADLAVAVMLYRMFQVWFGP